MVLNQISSKLDIRILSSESELWVSVSSKLKMRGKGVLRKLKNTLM
jgi:hypothetical protein